MSHRHAPPYRSLIVVITRGFSFLHRPSHLRSLPPSRPPFLPASPSLSPSLPISLLQVNWDSIKTWCEKLNMDESRTQLDWDLLERYVLFSSLPPSLLPVLPPSFSSFLPAFLRRKVLCSLILW